MAVKHGFKKNDLEAEFIRQEWNLLGYRKVDHYWIDARTWLQGPNWNSFKDRVKKIRMK